MNETKRNEGDWDVRYPSVRLVMPKYYGGEIGMLRAFEAIRAAGCSFIVAGRVGEATAAGGEEKEGEERFLTLDDVDIPETLRDLFEPMPDFRLDISSTELRKKAAAAAAAAAAAE